MKGTIRLTDIEEKKLKKIMEVEGIATANKTYVMLIENYLYDQEKIEELSKELARTQRELREARQAISGFLNSFEHLKEI